MVRVPIGKGIASQPTTDEPAGKRVYSSPKLIVYGDVKSITQKFKGMVDHNQSANGNNNDMGWS